jgi:hypothetical protein
VFEAEKEAYPHVLKLLAGGKIKLRGSRVKIDARSSGEGTSIRNYPVD